MPRQYQRNTTLRENMTITELQNLSEQEVKALMRHPPNLIGLKLIGLFALAFTNTLCLIQGMLTHILTLEISKIDLPFSYFMLAIFGSLTLIVTIVAFNLFESST